MCAKYIVFLFMLMNMVAGVCVVVSCVGIVGGELLMLMLLEQMYYNGILIGHEKSSFQNLDICGDF